MRRLLALMAMLGMLCLPGCTEKRMTQEELLLSFCCRVSVEYAGETYDCRIERQGPGVVTVRTPLIGYHWQGEFFFPDLRGAGVGQRKLSASGKQLCRSAEPLS